ncbi:DUF2283 domain-containing protein [Dehalococcoidia bacterium]|nr:DUF2283 domain-containing protein [Dehalococcoidia bacterium]MCL0048555.1 DUF2283 domain-containing protein [Dehalococcoidia bacterium]MCL0058363.1 DUF2283 domain-containing protein [Dehalococcoidia bacterium]MCL0066202.1 DUF2283 domain-containing protein [Dehalococcoidia bacterium]MCL0069752.1 DUF2283 domain-containing protein [Dehalococcoidia bacterium]
MRIEYDREANALYIQIQEKAVSKTKEVEPGVLIDFDAENNLIGIEILDVTYRFALSDIVNLHVENLPVEPVSLG